MEQRRKRVARGKQNQQRKRRPQRPTSAGNPTLGNAAVGSGVARPVAPAPSGPNWRIIAAIVAAAVILAIAAFLFFDLRPATAPSPPRPTTGGILKGSPGPGATPVVGTLSTQARIIDGIPCNAENVTYHEHAHLEILDRGTQIVVPANTGIMDNTCLYWLHTHDNSGEIHMEMPRYRPVTLGTFFDVWGQPLSRTRAAQAVVKPGESMRIYVNHKVYRGDPRAIILHRHTLITVEVGPPFEKPSAFNFQGD